MNHTILNQTISTYGTNAQLLIAIEECAELQKAITKYFRYGYTENILEETADVLIMCEQIKLMFGATKIEQIINEKLERLSNKILTEGEQNT